MLVPCITSSYQAYFLNYIPRLDRLTEILTQYNQSVSKSKQFDITFIQPMIHDYSLNPERYQALALHALKDEKVATYTYISFINDYKFKAYPNDFAYELLDGKSYLSKKIEFYKDNNHTIRKTDQEIYKELELTIYELEKWAKELPTIA